MFCDTTKLQAFLLISQTEAEGVKSQLCTDAWENYVADLVESFGVFYVKNNVSIILSRPNGRLSGY